MFGRIHQWIHLSLEFSISRIDLEILRLSVPFEWVLAVCLSRTLSISFALPNLMAWSCSKYLPVILTISVQSVVMSPLSFLAVIICIPFLSLFLSLSLCVSLFFLDQSEHWFINFNDLKTLDFVFIDFLYCFSFFITSHSSPPPSFCLLWV